MVISMIRDNIAKNRTQGPRKKMTWNRQLLFRSNGMLFSLFLHVHLYTGMQKRMTHSLWRKLRSHCKCYQTCHRTAYWDLSTSSVALPRMCDDYEVGHTGESRWLFPLRSCAGFSCGVHATSLRKINGWGKKSCCFWLCESGQHLSRAQKILKGAWLTSRLWRTWGMWQVTHWQVMWPPLHVTMWGDMWHTGIGTQEGLLPWMC